MRVVAAATGPAAPSPSATAASARAPPAAHDRGRMAASGRRRSAMSPTISPARPRPRGPPPRSLPPVRVAVTSRVRALGFGGAVKALVAFELAVIAVSAIAIVARFPVFALVDERAHYSYVQVVSEQQRLPVLARDRTSAVVQAVGEGVYPRRSRQEPAHQSGLAAFSYEAFQPPAYYLTAAPLFALLPDYRDKVRVLRAFDALLLACALLLLWRLAREIAGPRALALFAFALPAMMWPGVVVRSVTISNAALEMVAAPAVILLLWRAHARGDGRLLVAGGAALGAALLTRLTLAALAPVLIVVAALAVRSRGRRALPASAAALALPVLMLVPWLAFNLDHFHALTAERVVRRMQEPLLNPTRRLYGLGDLAHGLRILLRGVLPEEWWVEYLSTPKRLLSEVFGALFLLGPLVFGWVAPAADRRRLFGFLVAPGLVVVAGLVYALVAANWAAFLLPRYLYPELGGFCLFAALIWRRLLGERGLVWLSALLAGALAAVWIHLATVHPFAGP